MLKRLFFVVMAVVATAATVNAQEYPKSEFYGGYSLLTTDVDVLNNENLNGFGVAFQYNPAKYFGLVAEYTGNFGSPGPIQIPGRIILEVDTRVNTFLFGPRFAYRTRPVTAFGHYLIGAANTRVGYDNGPSISNTQLGMAVGGGLDINVTHNFAVRAGQFDWLSIRSDVPITSGDSRWSTNFRYQAGVVFKW